MLLGGRGEAGVKNCREVWEGEGEKNIGEVGVEGG